MIVLEDLIGKKFVPLIDKIIDTQIYELLLAGGRGSLKSSFYSIITPYGMLEDFYQRGIKTHACVLRKVGNTISKSVYPQFKWGLKMLGIADDWHCIKSPPEFTFKPTGQKIIFLGCDDPIKIKSFKFEEGYCKYVIFEEFNQFDGMEEIRNVCQSLLRGGKGLWMGGFNPSPDLSDWSNKEFLIEKPGRINHHSTYMDVNPDWLGPTFYQMANDLKERNLTAYENEYLGKVTGLGTNIFKNVVYQTIDNLFDYVRRGLDFGFTIDPTAYGELCYEKDKRQISIFKEIYKYGLGTSMLADELLTAAGTWNLIKADSQEPRTINTLVTEYGLNVVGCKKGQDSVRHGIEWLADLNKIIIDRKKCPNTYHEFMSYSYEKDKNGNVIKKYPDKDNHCIDFTRYALDDIILESGWRIPK